MPVGKAKIRYVGGFLDGRVFDAVDPRGLIETLIEPTGSWYKRVGDDVGVMKGGRFWKDKDWLSYNAHIYTKGSKDNDGYFEYQFSGDVIINRCSADTKKGLRCLKVCYKELSVCETHKPAR